MTIASIAIAFLLFSLGRSVAVAFTSEVDYAGKDRLVVSSKLSFTQAMPMSYANRIEALEGVETVAWRQWFGGTYIDRANFFPKWPVPESYFDIFPEFIVSEGGKEAFSRNIQGMIAGADTAEKYGWEIGDRIPIIGDIWVKDDNSNNWEFDLVGTFTNANGGAQDEAYINWKYFDESRAFEKGLVGQFSVKIRDPNQAEVIAKDIDRLFANSPDETKTSTEEAFSRMFAEQVGDIGFIINSVLAASFFTILLLTANTMSQAVRERTNELGVLKSIGYPDALIMIFVLMESSTDLFDRSRNWCFGGFCFVSNLFGNCVRICRTNRVFIFYSSRRYSIGFVNRYCIWIISSLFSHEIKCSRRFKEKLI